jgi:hypothetical protein
MSNLWIFQAEYLVSSRRSILGWKYEHTLLIFEVFEPFRQALMFLNFVSEKIEAISIYVERLTSISSAVAVESDGCQIDIRHGIREKG